MVLIEGFKLDLNLSLVVRDTPWQLNTVKEDCVDPYMHKKYNCRNPNVISCSRDSP